MPSSPNESPQASNLRAGTSAGFARDGMLSNLGDAAHVHSQNLFLLVETFSATLRSQESKSADQRMGTQTLLFRRGDRGALPMAAGGRFSRNQDGLDAEGSCPSAASGAR